MPILRRTTDGAGDSGPMCTIERLHPQTGTHEIERNQRPRVGWAICVGSATGRTFGNQDWWQTTPVTEILEDTPAYVRFTTRNSTYEWWA
jgi:hypothetical protein